MNKRLLILIVVLIALGATAWWLAGERGTSTLDRPLSDFMVPDTSKVDRIFIAETDGKLVDLRRVGMGWQVSRGNEVYPAKQDYVNLLLKTFLRVEVRTPVPKSAESNVLRVMAANAKRVEIYEGGNKPSKVWIVGHGTKDHFGTYMLLEKPGIGRSSVPFVVNMSGFTGILNTRFHANLDEWRSSVVFQFKDMYDLAAVEVSNPLVPQVNYRMEQVDRSTVRLLDAQGQDIPFDTLLVKASLLTFQQMNYEYIDRELKPEQRDSLFKARPAHELRVIHRDGTVQSAKFWYKPYEGDLTAADAHLQENDKVRMHALVQDTLLVTVQRQMFDRVLQPVANFRR